MAASSRMHAVRASEGASIEVAPRHTNPGRRGPGGRRCLRHADGDRRFAVIVCLAGMHRSGTSMAARLLNRCGLDLGDEGDLLPPRPDNPDGFWEHREFVAVNDAVLDALGGSWDVPPPDRPDWARDPVLLSAPSSRSRARGALPQWSTLGWKDPRNSLTLSLWRLLVPRSPHRRVRPQPAGGRAVARGSRRPLSDLRPAAVARVPRPVAGGRPARGAHRDALRRLVSGRAGGTPTDSARASG